MPETNATTPAGQLFSGVIRRDAIEDMAGAVRNFFDLEPVQLEPGMFRCKLEFIAAGGVFFYREQYPLRTHLTGELLHNRFGVAVPVQGPSLKFSGEEMDRCRLASAMTGEQMEVFAPGGLKQFVVLMDHAQLLSLADTAGLPAEVQRALRPGRPGMPLVSKPREVAAFSQRLQQLLHLASIGELEADAAYVEDWVYTQALSILDVRDAPPGRPSAAVLVRRAIEAAEAHRGAVRVGHLCRVLRVSPGTLENAFKTVAGVSPHTFFLRRRLSQVREVLLREDPLERKVTEIATDFGFSELGRFAVRYREMFGEKPSETLRRSVTTRVSLTR
jgi:AraC-like DNA-binding protein